jgi:hypothetical protein
VPRQAHGALAVLAATTIATIRGMAVSGDSAARHAVGAMPALAEVIGPR